MGNIEKSSQEWVAQGIVDANTADAIVAYEQNKKIPTSNMALVVFAVLGSILVALGISLMVAENWDNIPKLWKTIIAFCPMVIGQLLLVLSKYKYKDSLAWREAAASFLFLSVGATIALISQIYQLQGTLTGFILLWMVLVTPILFISKSKTSFLLYIIFATWFIAQTYWGLHESGLHYLWFLAAILAFSKWQILGNSNQRAIGMTMGWLIPVSLTVALGSFLLQSEGWMAIGYLALFQLFLLLFNSEYFEEPRNWKTGFGVVGLIGAFVMLYINSYHWAAKSIASNLNWVDLQTNPKALVTLIILFLAYLAMVVFPIHKKRQALDFVLPVYIALILLALVNANLAQIAFNAVILLISIGFIVKGISSKNLLWLNMGLLAFSLLVIMRFFDFNLSFFVRGLAFLILGVGFFLANKFILAERKEVVK